MVNTKEEDTRTRDNLRREGVTRNSATALFRDRSGRPSNISSERDHEAAQRMPANSGERSRQLRQQARNDGQWSALEELARARVDEEPGDLEALGDYTLARRMLTPEVGSGFRRLPVSIAAVVAGVLVAVLLRGPLAAPGVPESTVSAAAYWQRLREEHFQVDAPRSSTLLITSIACEAGSQVECTPTIVGSPESYAWIAAPTLSTSAARRASRPVGNDERFTTELLPRGSYTVALQICASDGCVEASTGVTFPEGPE